MATIYRFIVEQKQTGGSGRKSTLGQPSKKTTAKKGRWVSILGGDKGGVEHNRKMRAINPLLNQMTGGYWEKGMRLGRAGLGLVQKNTETGKLGLSGPAIAIIIAMAIQIALKYWYREFDRANKENTRNFKALENGVTSIHGSYSVAANFWNGKQTYNENK